MIYRVSIFFLFVIGAIVQVHSSEAVEEISATQNGAPVQTSDSAAGALSGVRTDSVPIKSNPPLLKYNPYIAGIGSAVIPGAGQIYGKQYVKGALLLAATGGLGYYSYFWYAQSRLSLRGADSLNLLSVLNSGTPPRIDSLGVTPDTTYTSVQYAMGADSARHEYNKQYAVFTQGLSWAIGCYLYNVADALDKSGCLYNADKRNPLLAGWLSAVPFFALGQVYNGKLSKAGVIWMTQTSLALMAYNSHRLMQEAEDNIDRYRIAGTPEQSVARKTPRLAEYWNRQRGDAFRERNMFMWYSLFFYLYGVFDAVVDAHLHDYDSRMKLEPDLDPDTKKIGLQATFKY